MLPSVSVPTEAEQTPSLDPLALYAEAVDTSDYVVRVWPLLRRAVPVVGDLLDVGAGAGQLGRSLAEPGRLWTAIEPSPSMQRRLAPRGPTRIIADGWETASIPAGGHDTVLAANIAAPLTTPVAFFHRCRTWATRAVVWVVPAQHGPRGLCLAGLLPPAWHGEDMTPGLDIVLAGLGETHPPTSVARVDWTFSAVVADLGRLADDLADRLGWLADDPRRPNLHDHLADRAVAGPAGVRLDVPKTSAVLTWSLS